MKRYSLEYRSEDSDTLEVLESQDGEFVQHEDVMAVVGALERCLIEIDATYKLRGRDLFPGESDVIEQAKSAIAFARGTK